MPDAFFITGQPVHLRWDQKGLDRVDAAFNVGSVAVRATFELGDHAWHASFKVKSDSAYDTISFAFQVFSGVFQAVHEFLVVREPQVLVFVTDREELAQIYRTYIHSEREPIELLGYSVNLETLTLRQGSSQPTEN